jgi:fibro-slime domain-containing protein
MRQGVRAVLALAVMLSAFVCSTGAGQADPPPSIVLAGTVRDFDACPTPVNAPTCHPDFENDVGDDLGIVLSTLGADHEPVYGDHPTGTATTHGQAYFDMWYHDDPLYNRSVARSLTFTLVPNSSPPTYAYDNADFFPIDGAGWNDPSFGNAGQVFDGHNFHFTFELHTAFTYQPGETFDVAGDDDVWLFINHQLVVDLGGVHATENASVNVDTLGLTSGQTYDFDFFFAERHTTGSDMAIQTSIPLQSTAVKLASFGATRAAHGVALRWRTASEAQVAGFDVFRGSKRLNGRLIPAAGGLTGASYRFHDAAGTRGGTVYRLRASGLDGSHRWLGRTVLAP